MPLFADLDRLRADLDALRPLAKAIKNQTRQQTDAIIEHYARLDDVKRFNAAQYPDL